MPAVLPRWCTQLIVCPAASLVSSPVEPGISVPRAAEGGYSYGGRPRREIDPTVNFHDPFAKLRSANQNTDPAESERAGLLWAGHGKRRLPAGWLGAAAGPGVLLLQPASAPSFLFALRRWDPGVLALMLQPAHAACSRAADAGAAAARAAAGAAAAGAFRGGGRQQDAARGVCGQPDRRPGHG